MLAPSIEDFSCRLVPFDELELLADVDTTANCVKCDVEQSTDVPTARKVRTPTVDHVLSEAKYTHVGVPKKPSSTPRENWAGGLSTEVLAPGMTTSMTFESTGWLGAKDEVVVGNMRSSRYAVKMIDAAFGGSARRLNDTARKEFEPGTDMVRPLIACATGTIERSIFAPGKETV